MKKAGRASALVVVGGIAADATRRGLGFVLAGCVLAALLAGSAAAADPTFVPAMGSPFAVGDGPHSIAVAHLNADGYPDLAVANTGSDNVSILLGDGTGGFGAVTPVPVGDGPLGVAAAHLNGDGNLDLVVANSGSDTLSILLGNGLGGFTPGTPVAVGDGPAWTAIADLNGDMKLDLAVAHYGVVSVPTEVWILLGDGAGGFSPAAGSPVAVGKVAYSIAVAHLNADVYLDLAVANQFDGNVSILLGNGAGGFSPAAGSPVSTSGSASWVAAADLNGDAKADLAVANQGSDNVAILLGDGTGQFSAASGSPIGTGDGPTPVVVADLNADSKLDLAVGNLFSDNVSILVGNGLAGFSPAASGPVTVGDRPYSLAASDLNGDGKRDLAVGNFGPLGNPDSNDVTVLLNATPTAVTLRRFVASRTRQGIELRWRTAQEASLLGFNVYRSGGGSATKLNRTLIGAHAMRSIVGASYRFRDRSARHGATYTYRLQAVSLGGTRAWLGSAVATA